MNFLEEAKARTIENLDYLFSCPAFDENEFITRFPQSFEDLYKTELQEKKDIEIETKKMEEDELIKKMGKLKISTDGNDRKEAMRNRLRKKLLDKYGI